MYITAQGPRLRNNLYCVEWDVKLYYTILLHYLATQYGEFGPVPTRYTAKECILLVADSD